MARRAIQDEGLEALIADRVNFEIRINLLENRPLDSRETSGQRSAAIAANHVELAEIERRIVERRKGR